MTIDERGQSTLWMLAVMVLAALLAVQLTRMSSEAREQSRTQSVADLTALAAVTGGRDAAEAVAHRHGATIEHWSAGDGDRVALVIRMGRAEALAAAEPADTAGPGDASG